MIRRPPRSTLFPYTTSSDLAPSGLPIRSRTPSRTPEAAEAAGAAGAVDRKSTRLNSSHLGISYAVFCLKKKRTEVRLLEVIANHNNARRHDRHAGGHTR